MRGQGGQAFYKGSNKKKHIVCIKISYISGIVSAAKHLTVNIFTRGKQNKKEKCKKKTCKRSKINYKFDKSRQGGGRGKGG